MIKQTKGFNWGAAGVSTGVWTGVRLSDILARAGVRSSADFPPGMHVRFASEKESGGDSLPGGVYGSSVTLEKAMDLAEDVLVAFMHNGRLLDVDHGYPVRIIVPGYIGGRMIKWLTNIDLLATCSQDYYHFYDNRVLPPFVDAERANDEDWWHKPEYICNELNINSAASVPAHEQEVTMQRGSFFTMRGYAYTGGGRCITRMEVSFDSGINWHTANLQIDERPNRYGKYWCWCFWSFEASHALIAKADEVVFRAWDAGTNTQPDKPTWNLMGMLNNPWFRIKVHRYRHEGNIVVRFEHPTQAGALPGGWMARLKEHPSLTQPGVYNTHNKHATDLDDELPDGEEQEEEESPEEMQQSQPAPAAAEKLLLLDTSKPDYTMEEVHKHNTAESAWIVVDNRVYDCTPFLKLHPGGADSILLMAGQESTEDFEAVHSKKAWKMLNDYYIGNLLRNEEIEDTSGGSHMSPRGLSPRGLSNTVAGANELVALNPKVRIPFPLIAREYLSSDTLRLRFALQSSEHRLGLPVGQHLLCYAKINGKLIMRAYTPVSSDKDLGYLELVIKIYRSVTPTVNMVGGLMSQHFETLQIGDSIDIKGPTGHVDYRGPGQLYLSGKLCKVGAFVMICGGTGITPIFQVLQAVFTNPDDKHVCVDMIYANKTIEDILLKAELDDLQEKFRERLRITYILSRETKELEGGEYRRGHVDTALVQSCMPARNQTTFALLCGPDKFIKEACIPALNSIGYSSEDESIVMF